MFGIGKGIFSNGTVGAPSPTRIPAAASAFASSPSSAGAALAEANSAARSPAPEVKKPAPSLFGMFSPRTPSLISHPASLNSLSTVTDAYVRTSSTQSALESAKMKALASDSYKRIDTSGILARDGLEIGDSGNKNKIVSADSLDDGVSDDVSSTGESELNMSRGGAHNYYGNTNAHTLKDPHTHAKNNNNSLVDVSALSLRPLDNTLNHIMNDTNNSTSELKTMNDSFGTNSEGNDVLTNMSNCSFSPCNAANDNTTLSQSSVSPSNSPSKGRVTSYKMPPLTEQNSFNQRKSDIEVYYLGILYKKNSTGKPQTPPLLLLFSLLYFFLLRLLSLLCSSFFFLFLVFLTLLSSTSLHISFFVLYRCLPATHMTSFVSTPLLLCSCISSSYNLSLPPLSLLLI